MATLGEYIGAGSGTTKGLWHLNGNSNDSSGNGNNGTDTAITYSQANGRFGQGAGLNGSSSKILSTLSGVSGIVFTYSLWLKRGQISNDDRMIQHWQSSSSSLDFHFKSDNTIQAYQWNGSTNPAVVTTKTITDTTLWHHYLLVKNGATMTIFIDGKEEVTGNSNNNTLTTSFAIGKDEINNTSWFTGSIDEVIVENVAWSASKVAKYYTMTKGRFGIV